MEPDRDGTSDAEVAPTAPAADPTVVEAPADDITDPDDGNTDETITPEPAAQPVIVEVIRRRSNLRCQSIHRGRLWQQPYRQEQDLQF